MLELLQTSPGAFALALAVLLASLALHELGHALAADRFGDPTARHLGRLTLDPVKHLDLVGTAMLILVGFGWAKPVPIQPANSTRRRLGLLVVALAGVAANLALAWLALVALRALGVRLEGNALVVAPGSPLASGAPTALAEGLVYAVRINVLLVVFNLLPIPPLDGSKALQALAPGLLERGMIQLERFGFLFVVAVIVLFDEQVFALVDTVTRVLEGWLL